MSYALLIAIISAVSSLCILLLVLHHQSEHKKLRENFLKEGKDYYTADYLATNCLIDRANGLKEFVACICSTFRQLFDKSSKN